MVKRACRTLNKFTGEILDSGYIESDFENLTDYPLVEITKDGFWKWEDNKLARNLTKENLENNNLIKFKIKELENKQPRASREALINFINLSNKLLDAVFANNQQVIAEIKTKLSESEELKRITDLDSQIQELRSQLK